MRILFCVLAVAGCGVAAAQAPLREFALPHDPREQVPAVSSSGMPSMTFARASNVLAPQAVILSPQQAKLAANRSVCYAIRSYNYEATRSLTEMPKAKDETTCVAAADGKLKGARGPVVVR